MSDTCPKPGCTIGTTGICLLNVEPAADCPVLRGEMPADAEQVTSPQDEAVESASEPTESAPGAATTTADSAGPGDATRVITNLVPPRPTKLRLSSGRELGLEGLARLAAKRPIRLIGLLGAPDAGKTMALVSMFLLTARGKLAGYEYRNSESSFAFDELSKGARAWSVDGNMLEQIVPHTELANERRPGFLHLRLYASAIGTAVDLAFPDLPGEWTDTLINKGVYGRLAFLRNADAIWIFVDGEKLADLNFGHDISARTCSLIGRLAASLPDKIPLKLVVTRADQYETLPPAMLDPITDEAADKGFDLEVHEIISVDKAGECRSGDGIPALLDASVAVLDFGAAAERPLPPSRRQILRYRSELAG